MARSRSRLGEVERHAETLRSHRSPSWPPLYLEAEDRRTRRQMPAGAVFDQPEALIQSVGQELLVRPDLTSAELPRNHLIDVPAGRNSYRLDRLAGVEGVADESLALVIRIINVRSNFAGLLCSGKSHV